MKKDKWEILKENEISYSLSANLCNFNFYRLKLKVFFQARSC